MARDLTALSLCFPKGDRCFDLFAFFWTPAETIHDRALSDRQPYGLWAEQGYLIATPGKVVDYAWAARSIADCLERFEISAIAFDEYRIPMLEKELSDIGVVAPLLVHPQGYRRSSASGLWMPESVGQLEAGIVEGRVKFQINPVMAACMASVVLEADAQGNRKFTKLKATGRIDGIVASAMSIGAATQSAPVAQSVYDVAARRLAEGKGYASGNHQSAAARQRATLS
jgi:phage terminase large subunit-like protein